MGPVCMTSMAETAAIVWVALSMPSDEFLEEVLYKPGITLHTSMARKVGLAEIASICSV